MASYSCCGNKVRNFLVTIRATTSKFQMDDALEDEMKLPSESEGSMSEITPNRLRPLNLALFGWVERLAGLDGNDWHG